MTSKYRNPPVSDDSVRISKELLEKIIPKVLATANYRSYSYDIRRYINNNFNTYAKLEKIAIFTDPFSKTGIKVRSITLTRSHESNKLHWGHYEISMDTSSISYAVKTFKSHILALEELYNLKFIGMIDRESNMFEGINRHKIPLTPFLEKIKVNKIVKEGINIIKI